MVLHPTYSRWTFWMSPFSEFSIFRSSNGDMLMRFGSTSCTGKQRICGGTRACTVPSSPHVCTLHHCTQFFKKKRRAGHSIFFSLHSPSQHCTRCTLSGRLSSTSLCYPSASKIPAWSTTAHFLCIAAKKNKKKNGLGLVSYAVMQKPERLRWGYTTWLQREGVWFFQTDHVICTQLHANRNKY